MEKYFSLILLLNIFSFNAHAIPEKTMEFEFTSIDGWFHHNKDGNLRAFLPANEKVATKLLQLNKGIVNQCKAKVYFANDYTLLYSLRKCKTN